MSINSLLFKMNLTNSKFCRFCNTNEETIIHILCRCRILCGQRYKHFSKDFVVVEDIRKQRHSDIIGFIKDIGILSLDLGWYNRSSIAVAFCINQTQNCILFYSITDL